MIEPRWWEKKILYARLRLYFFGYRIGTGWYVNNDTDDEASSEEDVD